MKRYTAPHVLTTLNANHAIQMNTNPNNAKSSQQQDNSVGQATFSTTGAYPGDE